MTLLVLLVQAAKPLEWAPTSVAGYVSLALSLVALTGIGIGYGKWLEKLNGLGGRVKTLELDSATARGELDLFKEEMRALNSQNNVLIKELGKHERSTEACREDTEKLGVTLGSAISDLTREVHQMSNELSNRLTRVETILMEK